MNQNRLAPVSIPDLRGGVFVVTGANSGIGRVVSLSLARAGAVVILACRNTRAGDRVLEELSAMGGDSLAACYEVDLADLESVGELADLISRRFSSIDGLINNAGVMGVPSRHLTKDGFELQFGTNHLGHFMLTARLFPLLRPNGRIVTVTSINAKIGRIDFDDLNWEHTYDPWEAYSASKLANLAFALTLDRRIRAAGLKQASVAAHPGIALTRILDNGPNLDGPSEYAESLRRDVAASAQSESDGAMPILCAATLPDIRGGDFIGPDGTDELTGRPSRLQPYASVRDAHFCDRLWSVSESLTHSAFSLSH